MEARATTVCHAICRWNAGICWRTTGECSMSNRQQSTGKKIESQTVGRIHLHWQDFMPDGLPRQGLRPGLCFKQMKNLVCAPDYRKQFDFAQTVDLSKGVSSWFGWNKHPTKTPVGSSKLIHVYRTSFDSCFVDRHGGSHRTGAWNTKSGCAMDFLLAEQKSRSDGARGYETPCAITILGF